MKRKIYAKTLNPECFDYRIYDITEDDYNEVFILGGRDYSDVDNKGYLKDIKKLINDYDSWDYEYYYHNSIKDFLSDMLPKKENGKKLSPKQLSMIKFLLDKYSKDWGGENYYNETVCECLSVITGKQYVWKYLYGCCQGDVVRAFYPTTENEKYIDFVEAWFFGTGTEIEIHDCENDPETPEDIEGFTFYTATWNEEELKKEIKLECGYKEDDDVEVVLWVYDKTIVVKHDTYKLAD